MRRILDRFTYANVMATFAVFLGLTGTAYAAAAVANNSVGSPQIINGSIKSVDIGNQQVTSADLLNNSVTGTDVVEGSLAKVPAAVNADKLGGFAASSFDRSAASTSGNFTSYFMPDLAAYGSYGLYCAADGVAWADNLYVLGAGARSVKNLSWSDGPYTASETDVLAYLWDGSGGGFGTSVARGDRFYGRAFIQNAAGTKKLLVEGWGMGHNDGDPGTTNDCWGSVEAWILK